MKATPNPCSSGLRRRLSGSVKTQMLTRLAWLLATAVASVQAACQKNVAGPIMNWALEVCKQRMEADDVLNLAVVEFKKSDLNPLLPKK